MNERELMRLDALSETLSSTIKEMLQGATFTAKNWRVVGAFALGPKGQPLQILGVNVPKQ